MSITLKGFYPSRSLTSDLFPDSFELGTFQSTAIKMHLLFHSTEGFTAQLVEADGKTRRVKVIAPFSDVRIQSTVQLHQLANNISSDYSIQISDRDILQVYFHPQLLGGMLRAGAGFLPHETKEEKKAHAVRQSFIKPLYTLSTTRPLNNDAIRQLLARLPTWDREKWVEQEKLEYPDESQEDDFEPLQEISSSVGAAIRALYVGKASWNISNRFCDKFKEYMGSDKTISKILEIEGKNSLNDWPFCYREALLIYYYEMDLTGLNNIPAFHPEWERRVQGMTAFQGSFEFQAATLLGDLGAHFKEIPEITVFSTQQALHLCNDIPEFGYSQEEQNLFVQLLEAYAYFEQGPMKQVKLLEFQGNHYKRLGAVPNRKSFAAREFYQQALKEYCRLNTPTFQKNFDKDLKSLLKNYIFVDPFENRIKFFRELGEASAKENNDQQAAFFFDQALKTYVDIEEYDAEVCANAKARGEDEDDERQYGRSFWNEAEPFRREIQEQYKIIMGKLGKQPNRV